MPPTPFGPRLRSLREEAGLSVPDLAKRCGMARTYVHDLESGRRKPTWETVQQIAEALGISTDKFRD